VLRVTKVCKKKKKKGKALTTNLSSFELEIIGTLTFLQLAPGFVISVMALATLLALLVKIGTICGKDKKF